MVPVMVTVTGPVRVAVTGPVTGRPADAQVDGQDAAPAGGRSRSAPGGLGGGPRGW